MFQKKKTYLWTTYNKAEETREGFCFSSRSPPSSTHRILVVSPGTRMRVEVYRTGNRELKHEYLTGRSCSTSQEIAYNNLRGQGFSRATATSLRSSHISSKVALTVLGLGQSDPTGNTNTGNSPSPGAAWTKLSLTFMPLHTNMMRLSGCTWIMVVPNCRRRTNSKRCS